MNGLKMLTKGGVVVIASRLSTSFSNSNQIHDPRKFPPESLRILCDKDNYFSIIANTKNKTAKATNTHKAINTGLFKMVLISRVFLHLYFHRALLPCFRHLAGPLFWHPL